MKFAKIAALARRSKMAHLVNGEDAQFLSIGTAVYKLDGMPLLDEQTVLAVLGAPEKDRDKWSVSCVHEEKSKMLSNSFAEEVEITTDEVGLTIIYEGMLLTPIYTMEGVIWIDTQLMAPLDSSVRKSFFIRGQQSDRRMVAVKVGAILQALILEYKPEVDTLTDTIELLAAQCDAEKRRRRMKYTKCQFCGSHLDHGEECDCQKDKK